MEVVKKRKRRKTCCRNGRIDIIILFITWQGADIKLLDLGSHAELPRTVYI